MSKEEWAFKNIVRFALCVDFYANQITTPDDSVVEWQGTDINAFYELLQKVIDNEITKDGW